MDGVTRRTRKISRLVLTVVPERVFSPVVAGGAECVQLLRLGLLEAPGLERVGRWILEMFARRPMACLAALLGGRRSRIGFPVMGCVDVAIVLLGVTRGAVSVANIRGASWCGRCGRLSLLLEPRLFRPGDRGRVLEPRVFRLGERRRANDDRNPQRENCRAEQPNRPSNRMNHGYSRFRRTKGSVKVIFVAFLETCRF